MKAHIIDGKTISRDILSDCQKRSEKHYQQHGRRPGLVTLLVGNNPASLSYVSLKIKTAKRLGYKELQINLPKTISEDEVIDVIQTYNRDQTIHGILLQLPLPAHLNSDKVVGNILPSKDVDGLHPANVGAMWMGDSDDKGSGGGLFPCTPLGICELLERSNIQTQGKHVLIIGRSNLVGKPLASLLLKRQFNGMACNATVSITHSQTPQATLKELCGMADILVAAIGKPNVIRSEWMREGVVAIDVGVNKVGTKPGKEGKEVPVLVGDLDFASAEKKASAITPVPGGVGPMTIAMLMKNTLLAFEKTLQ